MDAESVREAFVQLWGSLGTFWGVSPTTAKVFGWLFSRTEPADAQQIMEGLELSRGAVSMACRELREWGLVTTERAPGARRTVYHPETDLEKVVRHVVQIRKRREWDPILENLQQWIPELEADPTPEAAGFAQRLRAIEALVQLADSIAERILSGGTVSNLGLKVLVGGVPSQKRRRSRNRRAPSSEASPDAGSRRSESDSRLGGSTPEEFDSGSQG